MKVQQLVFSRTYEYLPQPHRSPHLLQINPSELVFLVYLRNLLGLFYLLWSARSCLSPSKGCVLTKVFFQFQDLSKDPFTLLHLCVAFILPFAFLILPSILTTSALSVGHSNTQLDVWHLSSAANLCYDYYPTSPHLWKRRHECLKVTPYGQWGKYPDVSLDQLSFLKTTLHDFLFLLSIIFIFISPSCTHLDGVTAQP